jgi:hypothetical protein
MGTNHVKLTINEDGLVTSVGDQNSNEIYETCVLCGKQTNVLVTTHIDYRYGYVEGSGQCCRECYDRTYDVKDNYVKRTMKNRTTLITVSAEDILSTPNDMELGAKVRQAYWSIYGDQEAPEENSWICKYCGKDTSNIDYDYLDGSNHLDCVLKANI